MKLILVGAVMLVSGRSQAESGCFHSVAEAAQRAGLRDEGGFRVEGVRRDAFSGVEWVRVARCGRPELPEVLVRRLAGVRGVEGAVKNEATSAERPVVVAGDKVLLVWEEGAARGELNGVAMVSGMVGASVRVRLPGFAGTGEGRLVAGVVRAQGVVELAPAGEMGR